MKGYSVAVLVGIVQLGLILAAPAEDSVQIVVTDQGIIKPQPSDSMRPIDQRSGPLADDNKSDSWLNGHFVAGAGLYIVKPYFENNPAFTSARGNFINGNGAVTSTNDQQDFDWGLNPAPVAWLGYVSDCGWGFRAHWWLFDQRSSASDVSDLNTTILSATPGNLIIQAESFLTVSPPQMIINSNLKLNSWDFDVTRETEVGNWSMLFSAGLKYAHLSQDYNAFTQVTPILGEFRETSLLSSGHNFNGAGPTIALEAKRPIGHTGISFFGNLRGAMLFGESRQQVTQTSIFQGNPFSNIFSTNFNSGHDKVLPVAELEMGAEFSRRWGNLYPFIRTGLLAQTWFGAGSATDLTGNLGFLGLTVTAGVYY
jgi:hypothetical protein